MGILFLLILSQLFTMTLVVLCSLFRLKKSISLSGFSLIILISYMYIPASYTLNGFCVFSSRFGSLTVHV